MFALGCFALASWLSSALLVRAAIKRPWIGALVERSVLAVLLSFYGSLGWLLTWNRESGYALFPIDLARALFVASLFLLFVVPVLWLGLFGTNKLGGGQ